MQRCFQTSDVLQEAAIQLLGETRNKSGNMRVTQEWLNQIGRGHASRLRTRHSAIKRSAYNTEGYVENHAVSDETPDRLAERRDLIGQLILCLGTLEKEERSVIHDHDFEGKSFREIAEDTGREEHSIRRQYHVSLKRLKVLLHERA